MQKEMCSHAIKFVDSPIVFQEIPGEISLCFTISNCPHHCPGCHSSYLAEDIGEYLDEHIDNFLEKYRDMITCVLFMCGDDPAQIDNLIRCLKICKKYNLKTALYSGYTEETFNKKVLIYLDYLKLGPYIEERGPLNNPNTNQHLYKIYRGKVVDDITYKFWNNKIPL